MGTAEATWTTRGRARGPAYSDSAHAFLFQQPDQVAADVNAFLA